MRKSSDTPTATVRLRVHPDIPAGTLNSLLRVVPACWATAGFLVWLLVSSPAQAQTVIDGSDQGLLPLLVSVLRRGLTRSDGRGNPQDARIRNIVEAEPGVYCGEVSTRGRDGQYGVFTRFVVETKIRNATIAPANDPTRVAMVMRMIAARCRYDDGQPW